MAIIQAQFQVDQRTMHMMIGPEPQLQVFQESLVRNMCDTYVFLQLFHAKYAFNIQVFALKG